MNFVKKVQIFIEKYHMIKKGERVLMGVSGGADSVCLLLVLHELETEMGFSLEAVHVEHGIRGVESLADAVFVEKLCDGLGIPFRKFSVDALGYAERTHQSVEEAARELRYGCFAQACAEAGADKIAVAHHANDSAETMLFHLARGTGIRGLGGIAPMVNYHVSEDNESGVFLCAGHLNKEEVSPDLELEEHGIMVLRPLLCVMRTEIEEYLNARGQTYRVDSTNADMDYTRNRIRGRILPELMEINAQTVSHMGKTAEQLREISEYLDEAALCEGAGAYEVIYRKLPSRADGVETECSPIEKIHVFSEPLLKMHRVLQSTLMHYLIGVIAGSEKDITSGHVEQVLELFVMHEGKRTDLPYSISARRYVKGVVLYHRENMSGEFDGTVLLADESGGNRVLKEEICLDLSVPGMLLLENGCYLRTEIIEFDGNFEKIPKKTYTKWVDYDKIKGNVLLRTRRPGDYLQIDMEGGRKKLKRYFIDEKIPADEREGTLLVADKSHILWVIGHRISEACKVTNETRRVLCLEYFTEESDGREN